MSHAESNRYVDQQAAHGLLKLKMARNAVRVYLASGRAERIPKNIASKLRDVSLDLHFSWVALCRFHGVPYRTPGEQARADAETQERRNRQMEAECFGTGARRNPSTSSGRGGRAA